MRILIDSSNYFASGINLGDIAILSASTRQLKRVFPTCKVMVFTASENAIEGMGIDVEPIVVTSTNSRPIRGARTDVENANYQRYRDALASANLVLLSGGGYFCDDFAEHALGLLLTLKDAQQRGLPTGIMSPGFEPLTHASVINAAIQVLPHVNVIGCRDSAVSPVVLQSLGVPRNNWTVTGDNALSLAIDCNHEAGLAVGYNLRLASYSGVGSQLAARVGAIVASEAARLSAETLILPINIDDPSDDDSTFASLFGVARSSAAQSKRTLDHLLADIGRCRIVVTGSYHAAVLALGMGVPAIGLIKSSHYLRKFIGLKSMFEFGFEPVSLVDADFGEKLAGGMRDLWKRADDFRGSLRKDTARQIAALDGLWESLKEIG